MKNQHVFATQEDNDDEEEEEEGKMPNGGKVPRASES